jgi:hypothetical protein
VKIALCNDIHIRRRKSDVSVEHSAYELRFNSAQLTACSYWFLEWLSDPESSGQILKRKVEM